MKLIKLILEGREATTIGDLEFGKNIQKNDHLPNPNKNTLTKIYSPEALEAWKEDKDPSLEVVIDRTEPWFDVFKIPAYVEGREKITKAIGKTLDRDAAKGRSIE